MALDFIAGCLGGCAGVAVGHPFDTVKVKLQTQDAKNPRYKGTWHCLAETVKQDSIRGLYRGMSSPMAGVAFVNAMVFGVHGNIMKNVEDPDRLSSHLLAGSTAGFMQAFIASPMELTKTRMQIMTESVSANKITFKNPLECFRHIYKAEGIKGLFRGQGITILREVPGFGAYFLSYEYMIRKLCPNGDISSAAVLGAGGMAGIASWLTCYPMDVIKSRIQADGMFGAPQYKGIIHCLKRSVQAEGLSVLTRGLSTTVIRAFPTNAATFAVVNWTMNLCQKVEENNYDKWEELKRIGDGIVQAASLPVSYAYCSNSELNSSRIKTSSLERNFCNSSLDDKTLETLPNLQDLLMEAIENPTKGAPECQLNKKFSKVSQIVTIDLCKICGECENDESEYPFCTNSCLRLKSITQENLSNSI